MAEQKKLTKSRDDKWIMGICGGIAETYGIPSIVVRLLFIVFGFGGITLLIYIILYFIMADAEA